MKPYEWVSMSRREASQESREACQAWNLGEPLVLEAEEERGSEADRGSQRRKLSVVKATASLPSTQPACSYTCVGGVVISLRARTAVPFCSRWSPYAQYTGNLSTYVLDKEREGQD